MAGTEVKIRPVILAGGFGKRSLPVSVENCPKQFAQLINEDSLFAATLRRVSDRDRYEPPIIIGNIEHMFFITASLGRLGIEDAIVMLEPTSRNTAAPALLAALHEEEEDVLHLLVPSDLNIENEETLHMAVAEGAAIAALEHIVLFGIKPTHADTGYGYIIPGKTIDGSPLQEISVFSEKPNETFARVLINQGALWNSGMFLYDPGLLRYEARQLAPEHFAKCNATLKNAKHDLKCITFADGDYAGMEKVSLDTLIMESTKRGAVLACELERNDVGSWDSLWRVAEKDENDNTLIGPVAAENVSNSYIHFDGISVAATGRQNCLIFAAEAHVLVAPCSHAQEIKALYDNETLNASGATETRLWRTFKNISKEAKFLVKQLTIWPGCSISLQTHQHRSEHWVVLSGTAKTEYDGLEGIIYPSGFISIPKGTMHHLSNVGDTNLQIIEVHGEYIGEDDTTRFEDLYGRT